MDTPESSELSALVRLLRAQGLAVGGDAAAPVAPARGVGGPEATIELPEDLLVAYLDGLGRSYAPFDDDPRATARGLLAVQLAGDLTADHVGGTNRVRRVALVDGDEGPQLVEERTDDPPPRPATGDVPHDDPAVFAGELEAIGGDPREHTWRLWCRTVASLPAHSPATRVALVESPGGEVLLRPDDPTVPQYVWSADPGT